MAVSLSPERRCLCQPQQLRSTFCCDRVFSVIDPNYRSQPARTERVTGVSPAAARSLEMRLPKSIQNEGQELGLRAAGMVVDADSGAASLGEPGSYRDPTSPPRDPRHPPVLPCPLTLARSCPQFVYNFSTLSMQFYDWHSNITKAENQNLSLRERCRPHTPQCGRVLLQCPPAMLCAW